MDEKWKKLATAEVWFTSQSLAKVRETIGFVQRGGATRVIRLTMHHAD
jgi:hypothetical protein